MKNVDITDKIGYTLLKKGIIDYETLEKSLVIKEGEDKKTRRNLGQILVHDFKVDHDVVFREVANLYAFREIYLTDETLDGQRIDFIKKYVDKLPDQVKDLVIQLRVLPLKFDEKNPDKLIIIAADPTDRGIPLVARGFGVKKYEVCYCRNKDIQNLLEKTVVLENEFLKMLASADVDISSSEDEIVVDEEMLDSEINKSALVNLIEGALVESVRQGASDIHVIGREGRKTDFLFRVDGNLKIWHIQENTMPEAIAAVIKDRSKNVDRFEREATQDGFIQRVVDGHQIRFRVSIMPIVGHRFQAQVREHRHPRARRPQGHHRPEQARVAGPGEGLLLQGDLEAPGDHHPDGSHRKRQEHDAHRGAPPGDRPDGERADRRRAGRVHHQGGPAAENRPQDGVRRGDPRHPPSRPGHRPRRRDARQGDRRDRDQAREHGSPDVLDPAHERRAERHRQAL